MNEVISDLIKASERPTISWIVELFISLTLVAGCVYIAMKQNNMAPLVVAGTGAYMLHHAFTPSDRSYRVETKYKDNEDGG